MGVAVGWGDPYPSFSPQWPPLGMGLWSPFTMRTRRLKVTQPVSGGAIAASSPRMTGASLKCPKCTAAEYVPSWPTLAHDFEVLPCSRSAIVFIYGGHTSPQIFQ